jgi:hypothetical protein
MYFPDVQSSDRKWQWKVPKKLACKLCQFDGKITGRQLISPRLSYYPDIGQNIFREGIHIILNISISILWLVWTRQKPMAERMQEQNV